MSWQRRSVGSGGAAQFVYTVATGMSPSGLRKCSGTESSSHDSISYE